MRAIELALSIFLIFIFSPAAAESIEGRLVSMDPEARQVTLEGGEVMSLLGAVSLDELAVGQLLRLEYQSGTVEVSTILVLEEPPPPPSSDEPIYVGE